MKFPSSTLEPRAQQIFDDHMLQLHRRIDRMFAILMFVQWAFAVGCALWLTPLTWDGPVWHIHPHVWLAVILGGLLTAPVAFAVGRYPGWLGTRHLIALCQVTFSSLLIHVTGGRIETHFHVFGSLAFLAAYREWQVLMPATLLVAADHLLRGMFWPETVFGVADASDWRWLEHAGWVLFEDLWLIICCRQAVREVQDVARTRANLEKSHSVLAQQAIALEETLQERDAIVAGALDAIIQMDEEGTIRGWNQQAAATFGWPETETIGKPLAETIIPTAMRRLHRQGLERYLQTGNGPLLNQRVEVEALRRDGSEFPIELAITAVRNNGKTSFCAFARDISERRRAEENLRQSKEAAEAANHAKSLFLANMSHEIRTPLNAILGYTDLMRSNDNLLASERASHLQAVYKSGTHLLTVINDILDLSKIEAGQMQYEKLRFSPHQTIVDVLSLMRVRAAEKGIALDARWLGRVPDTIESDPARLRQLLLNLVGNAIKFTDKGSVQILARLLAPEQKLQIEVIDTGVGIPADKLELIFKPFSQADASVTRRFGGTGLGLSICSYIADALGGSVTAQSCEGQGSTFTVTIDVGPAEAMRLLESAPAEALHAPEPVLQQSPPRLDGMDVLVVDDGDTNRQLLRLLLTRAGAVVTMAEHGLSAVEQASQRRFDVILMDMQMPVMDGYSATRELRARNNDTPVIALTANAMTGEEEKCREAGCDGYLTKPVNQKELIRVLSNLTPVAPTDVGLVPSFPTSECQSTLDLEDPELRDIVQHFVNDLAGRCAALHTAFATEDWKAIKACVHSLKGTAAMTGFGALSQRASQLEELALAQKAVAFQHSLAALESHCAAIREAHLATLMPA